MKRKLNGEALSDTKLLMVNDLIVFGSVGHIKL